MPPSTLHRLGLAFLLITAGCASKPLRCEFPLWVSVMPDSEADAECRRLGVKRHDNGDFVEDSTTLRGCAPEYRIITNGSESNMGHELKHRVDRNCK